MNDFCKACGLCCKIIPVKNGITLREVENNNSANLVKLSVEEARKIDSEFTDEIRRAIGECDLYGCKYLGENNRCSSACSKECLAKFITSPTSIMPQECFYIGENFLRKEKLKQKVRKYKEEIIHYEALITSDSKNRSSYTRIINNLQKFIDKYSLFGSHNW